MTKTHSNFLNNIKKLDDFLILREEDNYLILGHYITIKEFKEITGNIFQPYSTNVDKSLYVCFVLNISDDRVDLGRYEEIPRLYVQPRIKAYSKNNLKDYLDDFVKNTFH